MELPCAPEQWKLKGTQWHWYGQERSPEKHHNPYLVLPAIKQPVHVLKVQPLGGLVAAQLFNHLHTETQ